MRFLFRSVFSLFVTLYYWRLTVSEREEAANRNSVQMLVLKSWAWTRQLIFQFAKASRRGSSNASSRPSSRARAQHTCHEFIASATFLWGLRLYVTCTHFLLQRNVFMCTYTGFNNLMSNSAENGTSQVLCSTRMKWFKIKMKCLFESFARL